MTFERPRGCTKKSKDDRQNVQGIPKLRRIHQITKKECPKSKGMLRTEETRGCREKEKGGMPIGQGMIRAAGKIKCKQKK